MRYFPKFPGHAWETPFTETPKEEERSGARGGPTEGGRKESSARTEGREGRMNFLGFKVR